MRPALSPNTATTLDADEPQRAIIAGLTGDGWRERLLGCLFGPADERLAAAMRRRVVAGHARLDDVTVLLLAHMGIDPVATAALTSIVPNVIEFIDLDAATTLPIASISNSAGCSTTLDDKGGIRWHADAGRLNVEGLGEVLEGMVAARRGAPLRDVVSHPAIDHLDLRIGRVSGWGGRTSIQVKGVQRLLGVDIVAIAEGWGKRA